MDAPCSNGSQKGNKNIYNIEYHRLLAVSDCLLNVFAATIHIWDNSAASSFFVGMTIQSSMTHIVELQAVLLPFLYIETSITFPRSVS
jgi:hypothetical protein